MQRPAFVAFTGVDRTELLPGMLALSARYPIEWGVLIDPEQQARALFPAAEARAVLTSERRLSWAAHVCGGLAQTIAEGGDIDHSALAGFRRVQVNHGFKGSSATQIAHARDFGRRLRLRPVLQCTDAFPADPGVDWLYDVSFGTGVRPAFWPELNPQGPFCGYSGGFGPDTAVAILEQIRPPAGVAYWIDMESGVRSDGLMDLDKCARVCERVFGPS